MNRYVGETAHPCRPTRCNPRRPWAWWACRAVLSAPAFEPCGPLTNGKDASFPNSDNRRFATSTSESLDSRRRVWFRHATARVGGRLTARTELRWSRGTRLARSRRALRAPLGPWRAADRASPPSDATSTSAFSSETTRSLSHLWRRRHEPFQPKPEEPAEPRPEPIASTIITGREALGAFHRRVPRSAFAARSPPPVSRLCRLDPASDAGSPTLL